jgi:hypothetical protein
VLERGSINPIAGARVSTSADQETVTDANGRFELELPAGPVDVAVDADDHQPLRVTENLVANEGINVEYRLLPTDWRHRYQSTVRGEARHEGEHFTLKDEELHAAPGTLGDPFRVIGLLPGVAQPLPLLPYYVIRGATPGMNGFFLDGMRVPQLFHLLVGGGVVHARLVDRLDFYPGSYDVYFGRYAGGIVDSETRPAAPTGQHLDLELRLYDVSGLGEVNLGKGVRVEVAGHYGYPSFLIHALDSGVGVQYGDYQFRLDWRGLTVEALGSYDSLDIQSNPTRGPFQSVLEFHRVQVRERDRVKNLETEAAIVGGIDHMLTSASGSATGATGVEKLSLGWRFNLRARWRHFRLFVGTDGELSRFSAQNFDDPSSPSAPDQFGDLSGNRDGVVAGAFVEGTLDVLDHRVQVTPGVRVDAYHAGPVTLLGVDPRLQVKLNLQPWLEIDGGVGLYQQPPSFPVALPGIDTFALQLGLQRAIQSSTSIIAKMPQDFSLSLTGFWQQFYNVNDPVIDFGPAVCTSPPPESLSGLPAQITRQVDGHAYGMELLLRRKLGRVTGWVAYTLSRSERLYSCGLRPSDFDQSHVLNVVVQVRLPWNLLAGGRLYFASGRPVTVYDPSNSQVVRNNQRLPDYVQLDLRLDRQWIFNRWSFAVFLEVVNLTYSEAVFGISYPDLPGTMGVKDYTHPLVNGFNWILPSIGFRGWF